MKKVILSFTAVAVIVGIIVVIALAFCNNNEYREDAIRFKEKYEDLNGSETAGGMIRQTITIPKDNPFYFANMDDIVSLIEGGGTGIIYFGFPECPWCRTAVPAMIEAAREVGIDKIWYMNMTDERNTKIINEDGEIIETVAGTPGYMRLLDLLDSHLMDYTIPTFGEDRTFLGQKRVFVPFVLVVRNGEVLASKFYTLPIQNETPFMVFTAEQHRELVNRYITIFDLYLNAPDVCLGVDAC